MSTKFELLRGPERCPEEHVGHEGYLRWLARSVGMNARLCSDTFAQGKTMHLCRTNQSPRSQLEISQLAVPVFRFSH